MTFSKCRLLIAFVAVLLCTGRAHAHVGNKDVYETVEAGPYKLFVTVRAPLVIPGVATVEVRSSGAPIHNLTITPMLLTGEASHHPPAPDATKVSSNDPNFFTGSLWIMTSGSWQVRFGIDGANGPETASIPVPATSTAVLKMQRPMGLMLGGLGLLLVLGLVGIVAAAVREARLTPGAQPDAARRQRALIAGAGALVFAIAIMCLGGKWWNVEAADHTEAMHRGSQLKPSLNGNQLSLSIDSLYTPPSRVETLPNKEWRPLQNVNLLADHGHLMHLYAIRWPEMDAVYHLHPTPNGKSGFTDTLPAMPAGTYHLYADIVLRSGFPETVTSTLTVPAGMSNAPLDSEDASATPPPISATELGPSYKLRDGYTMTWDKPSSLTANTAYDLVFHLVDPQGKPVTDMQPYLGMAGHAAFVKTDGTAFAHTHPDGSAAMPAVILANESSDMAMSSMPGMSGMTDMPGMQMHVEPISSTVAFPYGFPSAGAYRIFIQMKHGNTVETGVFDTKVQ